jgi:hypothetical protein
MPTARLRAVHPVLDGSRCVSRPLTARRLCARTQARDSSRHLRRGLVLPHGRGTERAAARTGLERNADRAPRSHRPRRWTFTGSRRRLERATRLDAPSHSRPRTTRRTTVRSRFVSRSRGQRTVHRGRVRHAVRQRCTSDTAQTRITGICGPRSARSCDRQMGAAVRPLFSASRHTGSHTGARSRCPIVSRPILQPFGRGARTLRRRTA